MHLNIFFGKVGEKNRYMKTPASNYAFYWKFSITLVQLDFFILFFKIDNELRQGEPPLALLSAHKYSADGSLTLFLLEGD